MFIVCTHRKISCHIILWCATFWLTFAATVPIGVDRVLSSPLRPWAWGKVFLAIWLYLWRNLFTSTLKVQAECSSTSTVLWLFSDDGTDAKMWCLGQRDLLNSLRTVVELHGRRCLRGEVMCSAWKVKLDIMNGSREAAAIIIHL
jgi:hypothetical protein